MKLIGYTIFLCVVCFTGMIPVDGLSQCGNNNLLYSVNMTPASAGSTVTNTCFWGGDYANVNVIAGQTYVFSTCGTYWDTSITLYNSAGGGALAYNDDSAACGFQSSITWTATFTGVLRVLIDTWDCYDYYDCATLSVTWQGSSSGSGPDACVNATPVGCGQTVFGNTSTATGETVPLCDLYMSSNTNSLWYSFVGTGQNVTASLCGSAYDTDLAVYTGNCSGLICQAYNDDFCGVASQVTWFATTGVTYYIRVAGYSSFDYGPFTFSMQCSTGAVTASDCVNAVDVCTNLNFQIDPNGSGNVFEIPPIGSFGNPLYFIGDGALSPWGSDNEGCLQSNELNSTWMRVNILTGGSLTFTFGGLGAQAGYYDWIMYPYNSSTCGNILNNNVAPVRCNWNWAPWGGTGLASTIPPGGDPGNYEPPLNVLTGQQYIICFSNYSSATTSVPLQFGGTAVVGCENIALPVELVNLGASPVTNAIQVSWATLSEVNNDYFVLQRSSDPDNGWMDIATITGNGNSTSKKYYDYIDRNAAEGTNYYRLKQLDFNGDVTVSHVVAASLTRERRMVYPNPNEGSFTLISGMDARYIRVFNAQGKRIDFDLIVVDAASGVYQLQLKHAQPGLYFITESHDSKAIPFSIN